jgi:hypothetical protein
MKKNVGTIDKVIRILIALVIIVLFFSHIISGTLAIILLILSGILIVTSFISLCPIYLMLGLSTEKKNK